MFNIAVYHILTILSRGGKIGQQINLTITIKSMQITKKELKESEVELTIEVATEEARPFLEKAAQRVSQNMKIKGFRPGKAPYHIIKQKAGEMAIYQEGLDNIVSHFYIEAVRKEDLNSVGQPKIEMEKVAPGNPIVFKATIGLMPEVKLGDYKKVKVAREEVKVEDKDVDKAINDLRKMQVKEVLVEREARKGDRVEVDFEVSLDKVVIEGGQGNKYPIVLGEGMMIPGFEEQVEGMKAGEEKEFKLKFPAEYQNKMVAGKESDFKVKLLSVYKQELPEMTDDWAKGLGADSADDLKSKIKKNLKDEKKFNQEQKLEMELLTKVVEQAEFTAIPASLIHSETHRMIHEFEDSISKQGLTFDDYLKSIKKDRKELEKEFMPKAEERVKTSIVIKEIGDTEKIEVTDEEIKEEIEKILMQARGNKEAEDNIKSEGYQSYLKTIIRNRKIIDLLKKESIK